MNCHETVLKPLTPSQRGESMFTSISSAQQESQLSQHSLTAVSTLSQLREWVLAPLNYSNLPHNIWTKPHKRLKRATASRTEPERCLRWCLLFQTHQTGWSKRYGRLFWRWWAWGQDSPWRHMMWERLCVTQSNIIQQTRRAWIMMSGEVTLCRRCVPVLILDGLQGWVQRSDILTHAVVWML